MSEENVSKLIKILSTLQNIKGIFLLILGAIFVLSAFIMKSINEKIRLDSLQNTTGAGAAGSTTIKMYEFGPYSFTAAILVGILFIILAIYTIINSQRIILRLKSAIPMGIIVGVITALVLLITLIVEWTSNPGITSIIELIPFIISLIVVFILQKHKELRKTIG